MLQTREISAPAPLSTLPKTTASSPGPATPEGVTHGYVLLGIYLFLILYIATGPILTAARQRGWLPPESIERQLLLNKEPRILMPTPKVVLSGRFQHFLETCARDSLLFLTEIMPVVSESQAGLDALFLSAFPNTVARPVGSKGVLLIDNASRQTRQLQLYSEEGRQNYEEAAERYNQMAAAIPEIRLTLCVIPRAGDWFVESDACSAESRLVFRGTRHLREFQGKLNDSVRFIYWGSDRSPRAALSGYYLTDHHLTTPALYELYVRLISTLSNGRDLGPLVRHQHWVEVTGVEFLGSFSRQAGGYRKLSDKVLDGAFVLPNFKVEVLGSRVEERNKKEEYLAGDVSTQPLVHHYTEYFGDDFGLIHYSNPKPKSKNTLLVISDSQDNAVEPLLASHYRDSYFVDPRHFRKDVGTEFRLAEFAREHGVTDVIVFGAADTVLKAAAIMDPP